MVEAEFDQIWQQLEHEASHEADPDAARAEMESRARRLSRDRRAPRAPRPAAVRDRPEERRRGQPAGDEPADHAGGPAISPGGPPAVRRICPQASRWPPPSCARRCSRTRSSISCSARPRSASATVTREELRGGDRGRRRAAMSTARAAATITTMITRQAGRRPAAKKADEPKPRRRARPRSRAAKKAQDGRSRSRPRPQPAEEAPAEEACQEGRGEEGQGREGRAARRRSGHEGRAKKTAALNRSADAEAAGLRQARAERPWH